MSENDYAINAKIDGKDVEITLKLSDIDELYDKLASYRQIRRKLVKQSQDTCSEEIIRAAAEIAVVEGVISTGLLQRRLHIGYGKASSIIDELENRDIISTEIREDSRIVRNILISSMDEYDKKVAE